MSSYFNCLVYDDVKVTIRLSNNVVSLKIANKNADMHITLNPFQIRTLIKYLSVALRQIELIDLFNEKHFGDLTVEIEQTSEEEDTLAVPV